MKKVLALVLAVMMLSTMAFAVTVGVDGNKVNDGTGATGITSNSITINAGNFKPGDKIYIYKDLDVKDDEVKAVNSDNYSISKEKYEEGRSLVEDIYFDDDNDQAVVELAANDNLTTNKTLDMSFVLKGKGRNTKDITVTIKATIGYGLVKDAFVIEEDGEVVWTDARAYDGTAYKSLDINNTKNYFYEVATGEKGKPGRADSYNDLDYLTPAASDGAAYGTLEYQTSDEDVEIEVRVYDGDELYLYNDTDPDKDILKAYADSDAEMSFLNFPNTTFNSTATVYMYKDEDSFVYEIKNGKLVESDARWDDDEGCFIVKARTLGNYVFSDVELDVTEDVDDTVTNPDTGANDVVGIAAALGVVALVSAAAVSLKK